MRRERLENERFAALRSHYGFDSFYCLPGEKGAHEKGGVDGEVGRFRRRHLVPVPTVASLSELNSMLAGGDVIDDERHIARRADSVGVAAATEVASIGELAARRCLSAIEISTGWLVRWLPNMPEATRSVAGSEKPSIATRLAVDSDLAADCQNSLVIGFL